MDISEIELNRIFRETYIEYNESPLAVNRGFVYFPTEFTLIQLRQIIKYLSDSNAVFVDIGTGMGIVPRFIKKLGIRSISIDWPVTGGYEAIENVKILGVEGYYCEVGQEKIPIDDGIVDCVLFSEVIEHFSHSPKAAIKEIFRILKPGGVCICTTPNATGLNTRITVFLGYSNWTSIFEYYDKAYNIWHHHEYTIEELKEVFRRENFIELEFILYEIGLRYKKLEGLSNLKKPRFCDDKYIREPLWITIGKKFLLFLTNLFPRLRKSMIIVVQKPRMAI
jgi:SAM-dependent methyltransferase